MKSAAQRVGVFFFCASYQGESDRGMKRTQFLMFLQFRDVGIGVLNSVPLLQKKMF